MGRKKGVAARDGEVHTWQVPGNALVFKFDKKPEADDYEEPGVLSDSYLSNNGIAIAQITDLREHLDEVDPDEAWSVQIVKISFEDLTDRKVLEALRTSGIQMPEGTSSQDIALTATGENLMDIALGLISYGYYGGYEEEKARTKSDAIYLAERAVG